MALAVRKDALELARVRDTSSCAMQQAMQGADMAGREAVHAMGVQAALLQVGQAGGAGAGAGAGRCRWGRREVQVQVQGSRLPRVLRWKTVRAADVLRQQPQGHHSAAQAVMPQRASDPTTHSCRSGSPLCSTTRMCLPDVPAALHTLRQDLCRHSLLVPQRPLQHLSAPMP